MGSCAHCGYEAELQPIRSLRGDATEHVCRLCAADHGAYLKERGYAAQVTVPKTKTDMDPLESYYRHVVEGVSIRQIARDNKVHAPTVLRHIRRIEDRREDPRFDACCERLESKGLQAVHEMLAAI